MAFFNEFPYTDFHELNLDWIIHTINKLHKDWDEFKVINEITAGGTWDITKQYKAWTIVEDNNNGYISAKPVPAGVLITNTDYWKPTADYSSIIAGLADRVEALETTVGDASSGLVKDVDDINTEIDNINNDIDNIESQIATYHRPKKYIFLGDSYDGTSGWVDKTAANLGLTASDYYNLAESGHAFYDDSWIGDITTWFTAHPDDAGNITDIVICGGLNDSTATYDMSVLATKIGNFVTYVRTNIPNAEIHIGYIGYASPNSPVLYNRGIEGRLRACQTYIETCGSLHCHYLGNVEYVLHNNDFMGTDLLHPNSDGGDALGKHITNAILNGSTDVKYETHKLLLTPYSTGVMENDTYMYESLDNGVVHIRFDTIAMTSVSKSVAVNQFIELLNCNAKYFYAVYQFSAIGAAFVGSWMNVNFAVQMYVNRFEIAVNTISSGTWLTGTLNNLNIQPIQFTIPTMMC